MEKYEIEDLKTNLQSYLERQGIDTDKFFRCINPQHTDDNPSMKYFDDNKKVYCFGCRSSYDLFDVISIMENVDSKEAFKRAIQTFKFNQPVKKADNQQNKPKDNSNDNQPAKNYEKAYYVWHQNFLKSEEAKLYLKQRGIDETTASRFNIGFNSFNFGDFNLSAVIIPVSKHCFTARNISKDCDKLRYYKPKGCHTELFNTNALNNETPYCVITEGEIDCLSFETIGINALALCSANNVSKFIEIDKPINKKYILALDNDEIGKQSTSEIIEYFKQNNIPYCEFDNCGYKDANQALMEAPEAFKEQITLLCEKQVNENRKLQQAEM